jgi:hypothetical protein
MPGTEIDILTGMEVAHMEGKKMKLSSLIKRFENIMAATAFAEAGEFETAREMAGTKQKVLLVLTGRSSDVKCVTYALNFCKRMKAGLEILCMESGRDIVERLASELKEAGIDYHVNVVDGCLKKAVLDVTRQNSGFDYVVVNSYRGLDTGCGEEAEILPDVRDMIKCPLVVVGA